MSQILHSDYLATCFFIHSLPLICLFLSFCYWVNIFFAVFHIMPILYISILFDPMTLSLSNFPGVASTMYIDHRVLSKHVLKNRMHVICPKIPLPGNLKPY